MICPSATTKPHRRFFAEECDLTPEFADALSLDGLPEPLEKLERKEGEAMMADVIIACSSFVRETLVQGGLPLEKVRVVQFGSPAGIVLKEWSSQDLRRPLRVLYAGLVIQRKGIGYLLRAIKNIARRDVELVVMGRMPACPASVLNYKHLFRYEEPRPHAEVLRLMKSCDILVLPSLFEGQALVILEAMKCGLPVIITPNTGAAEIVDEGRNGFIVPIRSESALAERIAWFADNRNAVETMGSAASARASGLTWESYGSQIIEIVQSALGKTSPHPILPVAAAAR